MELSLSVLPVISLSIPPSLVTHKRQVLLGIDDDISILRRERVMQRNMIRLDVNQLARSPSNNGENITFDYWACQRPLTHKWGSGQVWGRICRNFGRPDVAFGKTDGIPRSVMSVDLKNGYNWVDLPFKNNKFSFGYWDPPYDRLYKKEGIEIWRTCRRLAILHTFIWPRAWLQRIAPARREAMVAVTMGPMKQIRCLQVFRKGK